MSARRSTRDSLKERIEGYGNDTPPKPNSRGGSFWDALVDVGDAVGLGTHLESSLKPWCTSAKESINAATTPLETIVGVSLDCPFVCDKIDTMQNLVPGVYRIGFRPVMVSETVSLGGEIIETLQYNSAVNILQVIHSPFEKRVRGRTDNPNGWISLVDTRTGYVWASWEAPLQENLARFSSEMRWQWEKEVELEGHEGGSRRDAQVPWTCAQKMITPKIIKKRIGKLERENSCLEEERMMEEEDVIEPSGNTLIGSSGTILSQGSPGMELQKARYDGGGNWKESKQLILGLNENRDVREHIRTPRYSWPDPIKPPQRLSRAAPADDLHIFEHDHPPVMEDVRGVDVSIGHASRVALSRGQFADWAAPADPVSVHAANNNECTNASLHPCDPQGTPTSQTLLVDIDDDWLNLSPP
eukprot:TRINITY_DN32916_c0_g1_i1.p1 TRINITY_DN32916_c0_g1~~TRINITY_DN32916_c0_g1_i1.p1  ORF type:complete len:445 (-),score=45.80 TRINITY_DN32916_c0_g1_i1:190-1434(-)